MRVSGGAAATGAGRTRAGGTRRGTWRSRRATTTWTSPRTQGSRGSPSRCRRPCRLTGAAEWGLPGRQACASGAWAGASGRAWPAATSRGHLHSGGGAVMAAVGPGNVCAAVGPGCAGVPAGWGAGCPRGEWEGVDEKAVEAAVGAAPGPEPQPSSPPLCRVSPVSCTAPLPAPSPRRAFLVAVPGDRAAGGAYGRREGRRQDDGARETCVRVRCRVGGGEWWVGAEGEVPYKQCR